MVRFIEVFSDGSGAPAKVEVKGFTYAFDFLGEVKFTCIGWPKCGAQPTPWTAMRQEAEAEYLCRLRTVADEKWFDMNRKMY